MVKVGDYLGRVFAKDKISGKKKAHEQFGISDRVKVHLEYIYSDPPFKGYEVTVTEIKPLKEPRMPRGARVRFNNKFDREHGIKRGTA